MKQHPASPSSPTSNWTSNMPANQLDAQAEGLRLPWSRWSRCESSFSLLLVPPRPGVFVLAEDVLAEDVATDAREDGGGRRMLAVFYVGEADDLSRSLGRLFAATSPLREKLATSRCYVRFAPVEDSTWRQSVAAALGKWFAEAAATAQAARAAAAGAASTSETSNTVTLPSSSADASALVDCDPGDEHADSAARSRDAGILRRRSPLQFPAGF
jgi:hypothetical protein